MVDELNPTCLRQNLPVTVGGQGDDVANCVVYDPVNEVVIVGGNTRSNDFGPANSQYGFVYAVTLQGDWTWGNYFQNSFSPIISITGCQMASDNSSVILLGTTRDQVITATLDPSNGRITNLYALENKQAIKDFGCPMIPFFINISNFWASWTEQPNRF